MADAKPETSLLQIECRFYHTPEEREFHIASLTKFGWKLYPSTWHRQTVVNPTLNVLAFWRIHNDTQGTVT